MVNKVGHLVDPLTGSPLVTTELPPNPITIRRVIDGAGLSDDQIIHSVGARIMEALRDRDRIQGAGYYVGAAKLGSVGTIQIHIHLAEPTGLVQSEEP